MKTVLEYMKMFADQCSKCTRGRKGACVWLKRYRGESERYNLEEMVTCEQRVSICYPGAGEPCDSQLSFDEYVSGIDSQLSKARVPTTYQELKDVLYSLSQLSARSGRFSRPLIPLMPDFLGTGIDHCLSHIDFTYLNHRMNIEQLIFAFFPHYRRMDVFSDCQYPLAMVHRVLRRSAYMTVDEMEILEVLITEKPEGSSEHVQAVSNGNLLPDKQMVKLQPYLAVLVEKGYCRADYHWISTKENGGHAYTQAAWIIQCLVHMFPEIRQNQFGLLFGIKNIGSYTSRVLDDAPFKAPIRKMFENKGLDYKSYP